LMHRLGEPADMQDDPRYENVTAEVRQFLAARMDACEAAGIGRERIILDPGFGFAKTVEHNLSLFKNLQQLEALGRPLLVG
ncbi:dihydropteroate synthase, partial [Klebsiella pneumoniae]